VSLPLTLYALVLSTTTALVLGLVAAAGPHGLIDKVFTVVTSLGVAIPNFWFGLVLVLLFSGGLRWFSAGGFPGWSAGPGAALRALTLPAIALALPQAAILARVLRAELLPRMNEDFIRTARAKGLSMRAALVRHALPNALIPVLTILGLQFSFLLAGAIIVENVFFLPGLGRLVIQAIAQRDLITVEDVVMLLVLATLAAAALVDLVHFGVDPRLRGRR
jgi:peptide/nickel transport system permease protein